MYAIDVGPVRTRLVQRTATDPLIDPALCPATGSGRPRTWVRPRPACPTSLPAARTKEPKVPMPNVSQHFSNRPPAEAGAAGSVLLRRYRPLETRATGGFGTVEICLDSRLKRRVAIKRIPLADPRQQALRDSTAAALAEAQTASLLSHPNIVSVIDFRSDSAYAYLVMEYVDGMTLEEFLAQVDGHSLTYDEAACIADALTQALAFAHENGVLHMDIKPANVLIDRSGHVKLADFGMATLASSAGFGGARGGTIGYMPPEQLLGAAVDERADLFSLAAVLYESLCAAAPFRAETPAESLKRIERGVTPPSELLPDLPARAEEVLLDALASHPEERPRSVADFAEAFLDGLGNPHEGRKSLANMIVRMTSDEEPIELTGREEPQWEFSPAEGHVGSRYPQARDLALRGVSAVSIALITWTMLGPLGVVGVAPRLVCSLAVAAAAGVAPQLGSALVITGFLMMVMAQTPLIPVLPVAVVMLALTVAWWLVWGRGDPAASMAFELVAALGCIALACMGGGGSLAGETVSAAQVASGAQAGLSGAQVGAMAAGVAELGLSAVRIAGLLAPIAAAVAAYALPPATAAVATAFGLLFADLMLTAVSLGGALPVGEALGALASLSSIGAIASSAALSAAVSWLLGANWGRMQEGSSAMLAYASLALPPLAGLTNICLAYPMEIAAASTLETAAAIGAAVLSSIIIYTCTRAFGYRKKQAEGDRP